MRTTPALALALGLTGCTAIADLGSFRIVSDAGALDAGPSPDDGGDASTPPVDACTPRTFYRDRDDDEHGDVSETREACSAPDGYVDEPGDCDDDAAGVHPAASEQCDGVDEDCDGAIDEGLLGPIGTPIEVVSDLGDAGATTGIVAHGEGVVVLWHTPADDLLRATFLDVSGTPVAANVLVRGNGTSSQVVTLFNRDGLEQIVFGYVEDDRIVVEPCSVSGACGGAEYTVVSEGGSALDRLGIAQLRDELIVSWRAPDGTHVASSDPRSELTSPSVILPPTPGATFSTFAGLATVDGPEPYSLIARTAAVLDGSTVVSSETQLLRVRGDATPTFDASVDQFPWEFEERCAELGAACAPAIAVSGRGEAGEPSVVLSEGLLASDAGGGSDSSYCLFGLTPRTADAPALTECLSLPTNRFALDVRGSVATVVADLETEWGVRDVRLDNVTESPGFVALPDFSSVYGVSVHTNHGGIIGSLTPGGADLSVVLIGCSP